ncbi:uncharacterized protein LOC126976320 isoform X2 [Leptidea sinapis]|uniref:uncharacterized protein LOC126976320 isoform X2 n=1 Tax=Leptidea sinapis TaxID=189913 RepID=UPI0021C2F4FF|nr:uncharacterized protein LOC126976320 isoform X2 [Leptidea sinapis]
MGQAGSQPGAELVRRVHTLPHEPPRHAPKVLPSLPESPRLRTTDNGAILLSGGTLSGRRPTSVGPGPDVTRTPHGHVHSNVLRSRSAGSTGELEFRSRERDPLHRSHTNFEIRLNGNINKRFGSEPDLRIEEEQQKSKCNGKNFRKKYRAPQPPATDYRDGSSPESIDANTRLEPQKKLRLFRTRNETKKLNPPKLETKARYRSTYTDFKSLDFTDQSYERRYTSQCKEDDTKMSNTNDMVQTTTSLKREEQLLIGRTEYRNRIDRMSGCKAKTSKPNDNNEAWKTPLLDRNFRHSERFRKDLVDIPCLRREKTFDNTLNVSDRSESPKHINKSKPKVKGEHLISNKLSTIEDTNKPLRKSLPSLLHKGNEEKDEFQAELKKATSRIRNELGHRNKFNNKTSQNDSVKGDKINPTKPAKKVIETSLKTNNKQNSVLPTNVRRPLNRPTEIKSKVTQQSKQPKDDGKQKNNHKENVKTLPERGQASGKESTPEHSPIRRKEPLANLKEKQKTPSKQFYFGMIENKQKVPQDHLKDFPGLGSPIIEEFTNFHLIEKKLLGYHEEDEINKFNEMLKETCKRNLSSESALSSEGSEGEGSDGSLGIALRLRPTLPKKKVNPSKFSPSEAWKQLASLDARLAQIQPLAVEIKLSGDISSESSPRSEQSAVKSGDSGISGDHGHSDHRIDSPARQHVPPNAATWTPQQDLGDSGSEGNRAAVTSDHPTLATFTPGQPFSLSLPRDQQDKGKQLQQGFNSLQKLKKSVSGALGAALGSRRFDLEHDPMLHEPEQNWFLTKSAPNSLSNPMLFQQLRAKNDGDIKEETKETEKDTLSPWRNHSSGLSWGGHVMYLPPAPPGLEQPLSILTPLDRPVRSKSSGCLEVAARAARAAALAGEMRERERSASPEGRVARAVPARVEPVTKISQGKNKRFTFQSTVRQLERRRLAEKLSKEADLKEQQRKTELEAMRRVEEEFQRKRAREKANIRQQLRLVTSGANCSDPIKSQHNKSRDDPDGSCRESPALERTRDKQRHSNASSEISGRSKSSTPIRSVELSEWRVENSTRVYRDWTGTSGAVSGAGGAAGAGKQHPAACARMPMSTSMQYGVEGSFSGSPRSDNYRLEFVRGRSPRTPRPPRLLTATRSPSSSGSELSLRQPIKISETMKEEVEEAAIVPTLRPSRPARSSVAIR